MADPLRPYGPLLETRVRVLTWNVWARFGPWEQRQTTIAGALAGCAPDVVALQEAWSGGGRDQAAELAGALDLPHHRFDGDGDGVRSGLAVLSRWPIRGHGFHPLPGTHGRYGRVLRADVDGPRGPLHVFAVALDWPPHYSHVRQEQVKELAGLVAAAGPDALAVVCGDFNAPPDADEIRMLTGRAAGCRVCWQDAWEVAGPADAGHTWSSGNPWAAPMLLPDRRIDYVFAARMGPGGRGQPVAARLVGAGADLDPVPSDHYGVVAELRY